MSVFVRELKEVYFIIFRDIVNYGEEGIFRRLLEKNIFKDFFILVLFGGCFVEMFSWVFGF